jgi:hypothetical protein
MDVEATRRDYERWKYIQPPKQSAPAVNHVTALESALEAAREKLDYPTEEIAELFARAEQAEQDRDAAVKAIRAMCEDCTPPFHACAKEGCPAYSYRPTTEEGEGHDAMVKVDGKRFRCECGCNVFKQRGEKYTCNSCGAKYVGEKDTTEGG